MFSLVTHIPRMQEEDKWSVPEGGNSTVHASPNSEVVVYLSGPAVGYFRQLILEH